MNCRICNSDELKLFYEQGDRNQFRFYKCKNCGLVNLDLIGLNLHDHQEQYVERFVHPIDPKYEKGAHQAYQFIKKYVPGKGDYLDIGCGRGSVLYFAQKDGWNVKGLELSPVFAEFVRNRLKIEVTVSDFLKYDNPAEKFDLVSLRHVLEHLPDAIMALRKISDLLKLEGYAHFEFPNINSITHKLKRFLTKSGIVKKKYKSSYSPGHCNEFSKKTFVYLLSLTGFILVRWETYSFKPLNDWIYNRIKVGTKARAIVRKIYELDDIA